jgi:antibiotic biosynthesis monooxygenase (ABM) superfamily enzyme
MNSPAPVAARPLLEFRAARASSVIVQRIPPDRAEVFLEWQRGVTAAAAEFPGYQATEIYPPTAPKEMEWVVVVHFDEPKTLHDWLASPTRAEWTAKLPTEIRDFRLKTLSAGFGSWFDGLTENDGPLPHWKMFLAVLCGLYPTVMLLSIFLSPHTQRFGLAVAVLIGNAASVSFLEWWGMPVISRTLRPWLRANGKETRAHSLGGLILVLAALGLMTFLFYLAT